MNLNDIRSATGARKRILRVGRGIGSGIGKTCGRGHKGQKARSGGFHKVGFEGGQMPLQRRMPKVGFTSKLKKFSAEITLSELEKIDSSEISLNDLIIHGLVPSFTKKVKVIKSGSIKKSLILKGLNITSGARDIILAAGGSIEA